MSETQTDLIQLGFAPAQQSNTDKIRTWEIAGTADADAYTVGAAARSSAAPPRSTAAPNTTWSRRRSPRSTSGSTTARRRRAHRRSAVEHPPGHPGARCPRQRHRGVRTPAVDVPVSTLSGAPAPGASIGLSSVRPWRSPRPNSPAFTARRATTSPSTRRAWTRRSPEGTFLADRAAFFAQAEQMQFPASGDLRRCAARWRTRPTPSVVRDSTRRPMASAQASGVLFEVSTSTL